VRLTAGPREGKRKGLLNDPHLCPLFYESQVAELMVHRAECWKLFGDSTPPDESPRYGCRRTAGCRAWFPFPFQADSRPLHTMSSLCAEGGVETHSSAANMHSTAGLTFQARGACPPCMTTAGSFRRTTQNSPRPLAAKMPDLQRRGHQRAQH
jgi:hypothetical protein